MDKKEFINYIEQNKIKLCTWNDEGDYTFLYYEGDQLHVKKSEKFEAEWVMDSRNWFGKLLDKLRFKKSPFRY